MSFFSKKSFSNKTQTLLLMASTNYEHYYWLINLLNVDEMYAKSLEEINQEYAKDSRHMAKKLKGQKIKTHDTYGEGVKDVLIGRTTFYNWRIAIYKEFGLLIQPQSIGKNGKNGENGEGYRNRFYLANGELLEENKKLREIIEHLVDDEKRGYEASTAVIKLPRGRKPKGGSSGSDLGIGFISIGNDEGFNGGNDVQFGYQEEPEMVDIIRFLMSLGESLPIVKSDKTVFILEPQALKRINDHWYVAGSEYKLGEEETSSLVIYDVEKINICEGDIDIPAYKLIDGFDLTHLIPWDWKKHFENENEVVSLYMEVQGPRFEKQPFCPTQVLVSKSSDMVPRYLYKIYVRPDRDFVLQYLATDKRFVRVINPHDKIPRTPTDISDEQIEYLRGLKRPLL